MVKDLVSQAVRILAKAEVIDEKLNEVKRAVADHEKRILRLEATSETQISRLEAAFQETKAKLYELKDL